MPHHTNMGQCTPVHCAGYLKNDGVNSTAGKERAVRKTAIAKATQTAKQKIRKEHDPNVEGLVKGEDAGSVLLRQVAKEEKVLQGAALGRAVGRMAARKALIDVPEGLTGNAAEAWADQKIVELLPLAVAQKEYALKYGDDSQQERAADKIMEANGRGKKDVGISTPTIILVGTGAGGALNYPWMKRLVDNEKK